MDPPTDTTGLQPRRLKKSKPPVAFNNQRNHALRRAPSAPTQPSYASRLAQGISSSATHFSNAPPLRRQASNPALSPANSAAADHHALRTTPELIGDPFDASAVNKSISAALAQRPSLPPPSHSSYAAVDRAPQPKKKLRQSASFTLAARNKMNDTITPPRSDGTKSPRQRYSDEPDALNPLGGKSRRSDGSKKKSTFSTFVNNMLGSPRRPTISTPTNPMHVTHVSIDNKTGQYTVRLHLPFQPHIPLAYTR